jgi:hypothetical protein
LSRNEIKELRTLGLFAKCTRLRLMDEDGTAYEQMIEEIGILVTLSTSNIESEEFQTKRHRIWKRNAKRD